MTDGHKHREVKIRKGGWVFRLLLVHLVHSRDLARVYASPYPWGPCPDGGWYLSPLSILHRWTGLTLRVRS